MSKNLKGGKESALKDSEPVKLELFYRLVKKSMYEYQIEVVEVDPREAVKLGLPDIRSRVMSTLDFNLCK